MLSGDSEDSSKTAQDIQKLSATTLVLRQSDNPRPELL